MAGSTSLLAWRIVQGVRPQTGELVRVIDRAGCDDLLRSVVLNLELAGATPLVELAAPDHVAAVLKAAERAYLSQYDHHRRAWIAHADRMVSLDAGYLALDDVDDEALALWSAAQERLTAAEDARRLLSFSVAVPTPMQAARLGIAFEALEEMLFEANTLSLFDLQDDMLRIQQQLEQSDALIIRSGSNCELHIVRGERPLLSDDGYIDEADQARGILTSSLPAGLVYFTVLEDQTEGSLYLPVAGEARDVTLRFERGRIVCVEAAEGGAAFSNFLDAHSGEARRISHIGIGANRALRQPIGWPEVDERVRGMIFIALGENRYLGGNNASSLHAAFLMPEASIEVSR
jgi:leucyl aminopeptidase (aminopeptidase T)